MDNKSLFHYASPRAIKARIGKDIHAWVPSLDWGSVLLIVAGITTIIFQLPIGWALIGIAAMPAMVAEWYKRELKQLAPTNGPNVDDVLDGEILGLLPPQPTPKQVAQLLATSRSGQFFAARLGLGISFLEQLASETREDMEGLWQKALDLQKTTHSPTLSGGILASVLAQSIPAADILLAHLQLDSDDLSRGIQWYNRVQTLVNRHQKMKKNPGGIGRDWAFGWIPNLERFGSNISVGAASALQLEAHQDELQSLIEILAGNGRRNAALVGASGSGKTELVYALAAKCMQPDETVPAELHFQQIFLLDAVSLISVANGRGELEGLINQLLSEAYAAKNIIICLDNAQLFFEQGVGSVDLTNVLLPILQAGRLPIILTIDEQKYLQISQRTPDLAGSVNRLSIKPTDKDTTIAIMEDNLVVYEYQYKVMYMYQALETAYDLGQRYVQDLVMPGRGLKLLESAAHYAEDQVVSSKSVRLAIEKTMDVKIGATDDNDERDKLLNLESLIHERMIDQERAVDAVSNALRRARAGVRNQNRPIGTFLFLGPTGVGKTELAKALAAVYFGGEDRLVRLDMNEFVQASDVQRLIADGASDPGSLAAQVSKQPFSVVLLDEIEKAHSSVLTTLLQLLDEGVMRDSNNREVSFRDAIVIATSNAGADRIREYIERGYKLDQFEEQFTNELISSNIFHPEFLNRFDEIVVFTPLSKDNLLKVVDLILAGVNETPAGQKVSVSVSAEAKAYLVDAGYDPRLGARPMRRVIQKAVENIVAKEVLSGNVAPGGTVEISLDDVKKTLDTTKAANEIAEQNKSA